MSNTMKRMLEAQQESEHMYKSFYELKKNANNNSNTNLLLENENAEGKTAEDTSKNNPSNPSVLSRAVRTTSRGLSGLSSSVSVGRTSDRSRPKARQQPLSRSLTLDSPAAASEKAITVPTAQSLDTASSDQDSTSTSTNVNSNTQSLSTSSSTRSLALKKEGRGRNRPSSASGGGSNRSSRVGLRVWERPYTRPAKYTTQRDEDGVYFHPAATRPDDNDPDSKTSTSSTTGNNSQVSSSPRARPRSAWGAKGKKLKDEAKHGGGRHTGGGGMTCSIDSSSALRLQSNGSAHSASFASASAASAVGYEPHISVPRGAYEAMASSQNGQIRSEYAVQNIDEILKGLRLQAQQFQQAREQQRYPGGTRNASQRGGDNSSILSTSSSVPTPRGAARKGVTSLPYSAASQQRQILERQRTGGGGYGRNWAGKPLPTPSDYNPSGFPGSSPAHPAQSAVRPEVWKKLGQEQDRAARAKQLGTKELGLKRDEELYTIDLEDFMKKVSDQPRMALDWLTRRQRLIARRNMPQEDQ